jgi:hypothetical protein
MAQHLYPPDLVMRNAREIDLSEDQRHAIEDELHKVQPQFADLQKKLQGEMESLVRLVQQEKVDEEKVRGQLDTVLKAENEIKKTQLGLMVHIKNLLTGQQQGQLREIRKQMMLPVGPGPASGPAAGDEERVRMMMERQRALEQSRRQGEPGGPPPAAPQPSPEP